MLLTLLGIVTLVRPVQPLNALTPILVMLLSVHAEYEPEPTARSVVIVTVVALAAVTFPSMYCVVGLAVTAARSLCPTAKPVDGVEVYAKVLSRNPIKLLLVDNPCTPGIVTLVRPVQSRNTEFPILVTLPGIDTLVRPVQP